MIYANRTVVNESRERVRGNRVIKTATPPAIRVGGERRGKIAVKHDVAKWAVPGKKSGGCTQRT